MLRWEADGRLKKLELCNALEPIDTPCQTSKFVQRSLKKLVDSVKRKAVCALS